MKKVIAFAMSVCLLGSVMAGAAFASKSGLTNTRNALIVASAYGLYKGDKKLAAGSALAALAVNNRLEQKYLKHRGHGRYQCSSRAAFQNEMRNAIRKGQAHGFDKGWKYAAKYRGNPPSRFYSYRAPAGFCRECRILLKEAYVDAFRQAWNTYSHRPRH